MTPPSSARLYPSFTGRPSGWYLRSRLFFTVLARVLFRLEVAGAENIPAGNYIVVGNHLSWIDPFLFMIVLSAKPRLYFIGAQQAMNRGWKAWLMQKYDVMIPFERGAQWVGKDVLTRPLEVLESGAVLGLFPEGRMGPAEGRLLPLQRGIGHIVARTNYPILPVALCGVQELYFRKQIRVVIGKPFCAAVEGLTHHDAVRAGAAQVENALRAILPPYNEPHPRLKVMRFLTDLLH